ncbi:MAG: hypothetical protein KBB61_04555 [Paludibacteraceae bacterium]|jgi:hypothetical protein|nr:hypothetical protein [Paludibacteraceae bacterium]MBP9039226.1 hypothetical protein [Paludibacteraceae bacterium]HOA46309.1 hypothetical protein [Paludibacteraceae bacterium]HPB85101.1 hypothetical protein [Paludibacteraceae bacterium]HPW95679.1 hypothetical protein [Paludibacteraceae bacterium]
MLKKIFQIISFYDKARWSSTSNYNSINFYKKDLSNDTKLLTHWLCYISDRQMAFERIWEIGGFVFSELADKYKETRDLNLLNPNCSNSFIKGNGEKGYTFISNSKVDGNSILKKSYGYDKKDIVKFTPRYYPSDYYSILFTFDILREYNFSLTNYIAVQINKYREKDDLIQRVLFSLYLLSYFEIKQPSKIDIADFDGNLKISKCRAEKVKLILDKNFEKEFENFKKDTMFYQKRAWCSLRDFFKSPEINPYFKSALTEENIDFEKLDLFSLKSFQQFELPGDVWNNNSKFRNCILENTEFEKSKKSLNIILREYFDNNKNDLGSSYPEQFDITFDFVPRMCKNNNCDICPIGLIKGNEKSKNFEKTCIINKRYYCPVALTNCNYKIKCFGKECDLLKIKNNKNCFLLAQVSNLCHLINKGKN